MSDDVFWIARLEERIAKLELRIDQQQLDIAELHDKRREQQTTITTLLDILADGGQLDRGELHARIQAAAITASHEAREETRAAQDIWDAAKGKP